MGFVSRTVSQMRLLKIVIDIRAALPNVGTSEQAQAIIDKHRLTLIKMVEFDKSRLAADLLVQLCQMEEELRRNRGSGS